MPAIYTYCIAYHGLRRPGVHGFLITITVGSMCYVYRRFLQNLHTVPIPVVS